MTKHDRPDWQVITLAIRRHYKPLAKVAIEINSEERHLNRLARGEVKDTKYKTGCRLLKIYRDICERLNKQPEWSADLEVHPLPNEFIQIMSPAEARVNHQRLRRSMSLDSPPCIGLARPMNNLPELARKFLNRSNA